MRAQAARPPVFCINTTLAGKLEIQYLRDRKQGREGRRCQTMSLGPSCDLPVTLGVKWGPDRVSRGVGSIMMRFNRSPWATKCKFRDKDRWRGMCIARVDLAR